MLIRDHGLSLVDWDKDGDLDLWVSNRTAPQIRFLRNDVPVTGHFVAFRLVGTKCNRDAIGSRVSLTFAGDPKSHLKTLRAGEGFIAQSSKWMHFGIGDRKRIEEIQINWPDGTHDRFENVTANQFYRVVQGENQLHRVNFHQTTRRNLTPSALYPTAPERMRTVVAPRDKSLALSIRNSDGEKLDLREITSSPTVVNLWSETCAPCLKELSEFAEAKEKFAAVGLRVVALRSVNPGEDAAASIDQLKLFAEKLDLPFELAAATDFTMKQLAEAQDDVTQIDRPLALPTSLLLDGDGRLSVLYRGTVTPKQLLEDVQRLSLPDPQWDATCIPFAGKWFESPFDHQ